MAIDLPISPRAGAGSVGSGLKNLRRGRLRLPNAGDVPQVSVARDPGLTVPDFSESTLGLEILGSSFGELAETVKK